VEHGENARWKHYFGSCFNSYKNIEIDSDPKAHKEIIRIIKPARVTKWGPRGPTHGPAGLWGQPDQEVGLLASTSSSPFLWLKMFLWWVRFDRVSIRGPEKRPPTLILVPGLY
jgi:hypothetical protein